ncbi:ARL-6-interacting protein 1 homolog [Drosophila guanche]|uniref:Blast:G patch domain and KOW motifs-containing protein n=1 Tax=Drosophila guanche TaxID=7266 RepID=A0A3B0KBV8_DROGU|nr:ARL-6-interacting protein 1 homolog [Drosophila guanche]SPP83166.1 blast:G patch domain and KOW motifs-containing protein [Drosophila guanche]
MTTSQVDQKRALNKLKHDLEPFRNAIVNVYGVLTWEKNYYPCVVFGTISVIYLVLWLMDLSVITMLSLLALLITVSGYVFPIISGLLFSGVNWDGEYEAKFEDVCGQIHSIKANLVVWNEYMFKERKSTVVVIMISSVLLALAWIGAIVNNLLLMYLVSLSVAMWPGLQDKDVFKGITQKASKLINEKIQCGKRKLQ